MPDLHLHLPFVLPKSTVQSVILAVSNRCDETREFLIETWRANLHPAK